jgi:hypothetical protein
VFLPNDLTNGLIMAFDAGSVKLAIANGFRVKVLRGWTRILPVSREAVGIVNKTQPMT